MNERKERKADSTFEILRLPELSRKRKLEKEIVSILGEDKWTSINRDAVAAIRGGDRNPSNSILTLWQRRVFIRRVVLTEIESQLRELNANFHGERMKDSSEQDSSFRDKREKLLCVLITLVPAQKKDTGLIRKALSEKGKKRES